MSSPKTVSRLNSRWFELFDRFLEDEYKPVEVPCASEQSAKALRMEYYKARDLVIGKAGSPPQDPELAKMYKHVLDSREVKVRGDKVVFDHRDHNWVGKLLENALGNNHNTH